MTAKSGGLLARHTLVVELIRSDWATRLDHKIFAEIVERYMEAHGNARVSLRFLERATKATRTNIIAALRRLLDRQAILIVREGLGTRPTEYGLNFAFTSSGIAHDTAEVAKASGIADDTAGGIAGDTSKGSSGIADDTESLLRKPVTITGFTERDLDPAAHTAPLPSFPAGAEVAVSAGGFESLWIAYSHRQKKTEARAAYKKLNPDTEMQARLVEAATAWRTRWEEQGNPQAARYTLAKWLEREEFECDPPAGYKAKAPKARNDNRPAKVDKPAPAKPDFTVLPDRAAICTIVKVNDGSDEYGERFLEIFFETEGGEKFEEYITYESPDPEDQRRGQANLRHLADVVGIGDLSEPDDLLGGVAELMVSQTGYVKSVGAVKRAA